MPIFVADAHVAESGSEKFYLKLGQDVSSLVAKDFSNGAYGFESLEVIEE
jgi:hypothetical protein